jgi:hypothetical protein
MKERICSLQNASNNMAFDNYLSSKDDSKSIVYDKTIDSIVS